MAVPAVSSEQRQCSTFLWCVVTLVILYSVGSAVFSRLEREAELKHYQRNRFLYEQMRDMYEFDKCKEDWFSSMEFCRRQHEFHGLLKHFFERSGNEMEDRGKWTFGGSAFFVSTLVTTLGYGSLHPRTPEGQLFTVLFGLVGIPAMAYVLSRISGWVVDVWMPMFPMIETRMRRIIVLCGLMIFLILLGGSLFQFLEGWTFLQACYFSACTLMSIGFGDFLPSSFASRFLASVFCICGLGVAASFIALCQIQVAIRGEHFAKRLNSLYGSVTGDCEQHEPAPDPRLPPPLAA